MPRFRCGNGEDIPQTQKERRINAPRRLPRSRPRSLTSPSLTPPSKLWNPFKKPIQQTAAQTQSTLFVRLSPELRHLIWRQVLGGHLLHIVRVRKRLLAISCTEDVDPDHWTKRHGCWGLTSGTLTLGTTPGWYMYSHSYHPSKPAALLLLLQACRRIYAEAITILYTENVFDLNHLDTVFYMQQSILPQRLEQIKVLSFRWDFKWAAEHSKAPYDVGTWREVGDTLTNFTGLVELTVHLTGGDFTRKDSWEVLLEPLMKVKAAKRFDVFLPWEEEQCMEVVKEHRYPFKIVSKIEMPLAPEEYCDHDIMEV